MGVGQEQSVGADQGAGPDTGNDRFAATFIDLHNEHRRALDAVLVQLDLRRRQRGFGRRAFAILRDSGAERHHACANSDQHTEQRAEQRDLKL